jgi:transposase-like protein
MARRGVEVTHATIRQWWRTFGQQYANPLKRRPRPGAQRHLDEVFLKHMRRDPLASAVSDEVV